VKYDPSKSPRQLLREEGLDWDDNAALSPMEITGAYFIRGRREGLFKAIEGACELLGIPFRVLERHEILELEVDALDDFHTKLVRTRRWPTQ
jgi:hypothetical protein